MKRASPALALYAVGAYLFLHLPLLILAVFSFNPSRFTVWEGFSLDWYAAALQDSQLIEAAANSLIIAIVATLISTVIGTLCAYGLWKRNSPAAGRRRCTCRWSRRRSSPAFRCSPSINGSSDSCASSSACTR